MSKFESSAAPDLSSDERSSGVRRRAKPLELPKRKKSPADIDDVTDDAVLEEDELDGLKDLTPFAREVEGPKIATLTEDDLIPEEAKYRNLDEVPDGPEKRRALELLKGKRQSHEIKRKQMTEAAEETLRAEREETQTHLASVRSELARERRRANKDVIPEKTKALQEDMKRVVNIVAAEDEAEEGKFLPKVDAYKMIAERYRKITQDLPDYLAQPQTPEIKETIFQLHREADELAEWKKEVDHAKGIGPRALVSNRFYEKSFKLKKRRASETSSEDAA
jgi:hypothetical protein